MSTISEEIAQNLPDLPLEMQQETLDFVLFLKAKLASRADNFIEPLEVRNQQADAVWADYQLSGKSVGNEAVTAWLDTWGTDQESSCPQA
jgi:hypothetical protein